ncbi:hypothetical protein D1AOALGA4SA_11959 [Olavius algarvensis Delta 1 endosymbiont]|nr:hypothetical protein D1AOALGA4SA_11959 [Olavius algarvensis Delta 1 endosymbiont]
MLEKWNDGWMKGRRRRQINFLSAPAKIRSQSTQTKIPALH